MTLHYDFPHIQHIDDVLPRIRDQKSFVVVEKDYGVTIVNYVMQTTDTFPPVFVGDLEEGDDLDEIYDYTAAMRRECRGLIFDTRTGAIIRRPFHKFFNLGERADGVPPDLTKPHRVVEKLDGSMITPMLLPDGSLRWGSKMGITSVSMQAEVFIAQNPQYEQLARDAIANDKTPIFEWCSRQQRIVVDYPQDQLVLLAVRHNVTGRYSCRETLEDMSASYGVPVVRELASSIDDLDTFVATIRAQEQDEGAIVLWDDGHMLKVKADAYVTLHRAKSMIERERDVVALIIDEKCDDLIPLLSAEDKSRLAVFGRAVLLDLETFSQRVAHQVSAMRANDCTRKDFALHHGDRVTPAIKAAVFRLWDEPLSATMADDYTVQHVRKLCNSRSSYVKAKEILTTANWFAPADDLEEAA